MRKAILGVWRFPDRIERARLVQIAERLIATDSGYSELSIRRISKSQIGICFRYESINDSTLSDAELEERYIWRTAGVIAASLHTQAFGWDVAVPFWSYRASPAPLAA